jgi:dihydroorotase
LGEATGIATVLEFAAATGARLVLRQVCTTRGFEIVRQAKRGPLAGLIGVEVTPHNLHLDVGTYDRLGTFAQMLPPLRSPGDCAAAVEALSDGTVDFVGSDHAPHSPEEKAADSAWEAACGTPGLDTLAASVLDLARRGAIPYARVAEVLSERPAALFGLKDRKGTLGPGADGDLVLIDPEVVRTVTPEMIRSKAGRSPFEGTTLTGWPVLTVLRGEVVAEEGRIVASGPKGRFVDRGDDPAA